MRQSLSSLKGLKQRGCDCYMTFPTGNKTMSNVKHAWTIHDSPCPCRLANILRGAFVVGIYAPQCPRLEVRLDQRVHHY